MKGARESLIWREQKAVSAFCSLSLVLGLSLAVHASAPAPLVPNGSFEKGVRGAPAGWTLSGGKGRWLSAKSDPKGAAEGDRWVSVFGSGSDSNYWRSAPLEFEPGAVYALNFKARGRARRGTAITGPEFCNRDIHRPRGDWRAYTSIFVTPASVKRDSAFLRFGQWNMTGTVMYDAVSLERVQAVSARVEDLWLGEGESVSGSVYEFEAPLDSEFGNYSRPLKSHDCDFNSDRWVFDSGSSVTYTHGFAGREQVSASVSVGIGYYVAGELLVECSADGAEWVELGVVRGKDRKSFSIPGTILPAGGILVRLSGRSSRTDGKNSDPGSFQVGQYSFRSVMTGPPLQGEGRTRFVTLISADPRFKATVLSTGDQRPGGDNCAEVEIVSVGADSFDVQPAATIEGPAGRETKASTKSTVGPEKRVLRIPYSVQGTGRHEVTLSLGEDAGWSARFSFDVPEFYRFDFGELLPGSGPEVALWWASSGWKVSDVRVLPSASGAAVRVAAARNEAEAVQLVIRPGRTLTGFKAVCETLKGPRGASIPASRVDLLKVAYVPVTLPSDETGFAADWPDPLPELEKGAVLAANRNLPLWIRVRVPEGIPAGVYRANIRLSAKGWKASVPIEVSVYGFDLPDVMTCETAFGFWPDLVYKYHRLEKHADRRLVLDKYLSCLGDNHISIYDPVPMDNLKVRWPEGPKWEGGAVDVPAMPGGPATIRVDDLNPRRQIYAEMADPVAIPRGGVRVSFRHKAAPEADFLVALQYYNSSGDWMFGKNRDFRFKGTGGWQEFAEEIREFPAGARKVSLRMYGCAWADDGSTTGTAWYDKVSISALAGGKTLVSLDYSTPSPESLKPIFDWKPWDAAMERVFNKYHFNTFTVDFPGLGGGSFYARREPRLLGFAEDTAQYKAAMAAYGQAMEAHLKSKGWLDKSFVYWFDEPDEKDYAFVMNGFRKLRETAPGIGRMLTEQVEEGLVGGPNIWCPVSASWDDEKAKGRMEAGDRFWWYICTWPKAPYAGEFIDHPGTEMRVWLWQTWKRKISGILIWDTNYWTSEEAYPDPDRPQNPWTDPMAWTSSYGTAPGERKPWGNGDGRFIYPPLEAADANPRKAVLSGPVTSVRMEMLRDGIEDYEYLAILKRLIEKKADVLSAEQKARYEALLEVPAEITASLTEFTKDPAPIERRRAEVAKAIGELNQRP